MPRNMNLKCALASVLGALSLSSLSLPAAAVEANPVNRRVVGFADLAVNHPAGAAVLYARITAAAREVCEPQDTRALASVALARRCLEAAIERAVAEVGAPTLTSYHLARTTKHAITLAKRD